MVIFQFAMLVYQRVIGILTDMGEYWDMNVTGVYRDIHMMGIYLDEFKVVALQTARTGFPFGLKDSPVQKLGAGR